MKRRILMSVTDKRYLQKFEILTLEWEIISTGGTAEALKNAGIHSIPIEEITGFPEMMDGRLKTLHPNIFGGILADREKPEHMEAISEHGIRPIDMVVVNLYEFGKKPGIENIDIGGPSLLRAAAKNMDSVAVVVDPSDYDIVIGDILCNGVVSQDLREELAQKVFEHTSEYDRAIAAWMRSRRRDDKQSLLSLAPKI